MNVIQHAANIAKLMQSISDAISAELEHTPFDPIVQPRPFTLGDLLESLEITPPAGLEAIGLDDMNIRRIVIELSHDRTCFKIWTPFSESFVKELKRQIPKHARSWDGDERCWRVNTYWFGNAQRLLPEQFPDLDRHYTDRAIRMCEQLARDYEREEFAKDGPDDEPDEDPPPQRTRKKRKSTNTTQKKKTRAGHFVDDEEEPRKKRRSTHEDDDEPRQKKPGPYKILGVSPDAPDEVIKAAHKVLARKYHTDLGGDEEKMKQINSAFEEIKELRKWTK